MFHKNPRTFGQCTRPTTRLVETLIDFILPSRCPVCSCLLDASTPHALSRPCFSKVNFIRDPLCITCGTPFASHTEVSHRGGRCRTGTRSYSKARAVCTFSGSIKTAIYAFKYQQKTYLAKALVALMEGRPFDLDLNKYDMLVPVPLHRNRLRERGYNQSLLLARETGRRFGVPVDKSMLRRIRDSVPQVELTGTKRLENVRKVFSLGGDPTGKRLLLVDDVLTTGATANECAGVLRRGGANRVDVFTIARVV